MYVCVCVCVCVCVHSFFSRKLILFPNLITFLILLQIISSLDSMYSNNRKLYSMFYAFHSFPMYKCNSLRKKNI